MNKIGRNDPCPCGSGKKYKKCCEKGNVVTIDSLLEEETQRIQFTILDFAYTNYEWKLNHERDRAAQKYHLFTLEEAAVDILFDGWFVTTYPIEKGKTVIEDFIKKQLHTVKRHGVKEIISKWNQSQFVIGEVTEIEGNRVRVHDILRDQIFDFQDNSRLEVGDYAAGIALPYRENIVIPFSILFKFKKEFGTKYRRFLHSEYDSFNGSVQDYFKESYLRIVDHFMAINANPKSESEFEMVDIGELEWGSVNEKLAAEELVYFMEDYQVSNEVISLSLQLLSQYFEMRSPRIQNPSIYAASMFHLVAQYITFGHSFSQKELARHFDVSVGSISSRYLDMDEFIGEDLLRTIQSAKSNGNRQQLA